MSDHWNELKQCEAEPLACWSTGDWPERNAYVTEALKHGRRVLAEVSSPQQEERANCEWAIDDKGGDSVYETQCGHNFYFDDSTSTGENGFRFCAYCGGRLVEVKTSEHED